MLDQSFSAKNFHKIILKENRKGNNLEKRFFIDDIFNLYRDRLKPINDKLKNSLKAYKEENLSPQEFDEEGYKNYKKALRAKKKEITEEKENKLIQKLEVISSKIQADDFKIKLTQGTFNGKSIYQIGDNAEQYFAIKKLQENFQKLYGVKQSNRFEIVNQVQRLLNDKFPKIIIRTDIKSFYESIPNDKLINQLNADSLLTSKSKELIRGIIRSYSRLSNNGNLGIPRGIGISAFLAEYYMRRIDERIKELDNVIYYARYVDDIFIIFIPKITKTSQNCLVDVKNIIESDDFKLTLNTTKTKCIDVSTFSNKIPVNNINEDSPFKIEYLGYSFGIEKLEKKPKNTTIDISLTESKVQRYKNKIRAMFDIYYRYKDKTKGFRHLKSRLKFLTGNTRLVNSKSNVYVGIYFSNMLLTNPQESFNELDNLLNDCIDSLELDNHQINALKKYSFIDGFINRRFYKFTSTELKNITKIWKSI